MSIAVAMRKYEKVNIAGRYHDVVTSAAYHFRRGLDAARRGIHSENSDPLAMGPLLHEFYGLCLIAHQSFICPAALSVPAQLIVGRGQKSVSARPPSLGGDILLHPNLVSETLLFDKLSHHGILGAVLEYVPLQIAARLEVARWEKLAAGCILAAVVGRCVLQLPRLVVCAWAAVETSILCAVFLAGVSCWIIASSLWARFLADGPASRPDPSQHSSRTTPAPLASSLGQNLPPMQSSALASPNLLENLAPPLVSPVQNDSTRTQRRAPSDVGQAPSSIPERRLFQYRTTPTAESSQPQPRSETNPSDYFSMPGSFVSQGPQTRPSSSSEDGQARQSDVSSSRRTQASDQLHDAVAYLYQHVSQGSPPDVCHWALSDPEQTTLCQFLNRLTQTSDYRDPSVRAHFTDRACSILTAMDRDAALRRQCLELIADGLHSCNDRVSFVMNQVELATRVFEAERSDRNGKALRKLCLGIMALEIVHKHARKKVASLRFADELEVFLAYETGLRESLRLPVASQTMLYRVTAQVSQADLDEARREAQTVMGDPAQIAAYLDSCALWQNHLRRQQALRWSYARAKKKPLPAESATDKLQCPFTLDAYAEVQEPLFWARGQALVVYEAQPLLRYWTLYGNEPTTRQKCRLDDFFRAQPANVDATWRQPFAALTQRFCRV